MVYEYIIKNYQGAEPIFLSDMKIGDTEGLTI